MVLVMEPVKSILVKRINYMHEHDKQQKSPQNVPSARGKRKKTSKRQISKRKDINNTTRSPTYPQTSGLATKKSDSHHKTH
jgi:hypothetical protein